MLNYVVDLWFSYVVQVSDVRQSDAGHYQCTPYNELGPGVQSPRIHVQVKGR